MTLSDQDKKAALDAYCERFGIAFWYACRIAEHKDERGLDERDAREFIRLENWLSSWQQAMEYGAKMAYERILPAEPSMQVIRLFMTLSERDDFDSPALGTSGFLRVLRAYQEFRSISKELEAPAPVTVDDQSDDLISAINASGGNGIWRSKPSRWQPIETAPKDELILLYAPADKLWTPEKLHYGHDIRVSTTRRWCWATHWMPLPAAPKVEG